GRAEGKAAAAGGSASDRGRAAIVSRGDGEGHVAGTGAAGSADTHVSRAGDDGRLGVIDRHSKAARAGIAVAIAGAAIHSSRPQGKAAAAGWRASDSGGAAVVSGGDDEGHIAGAGAGGGTDTD